MAAHCSGSVSASLETYATTPGRDRPALLIAAAGSVPGANGTFFRSDISIVNYRGQDQLVSLQWLLQRDVRGALRAAVLQIVVEPEAGIDPRLWGQPTGRQSTTSPVIAGPRWPSRC
jgi:hypothetical protein